MGDKKSRKRKLDAIAPGVRVLLELGFDSSEWLIGAGYSKGFLSGSRYTVVWVCHRPSGRERRESFYAASKAAARRDAVAVAQQLVQELRQG
jgi:hypothetical protein